MHSLDPSQLSSECISSKEVKVSKYGGMRVPRNCLLCHGIRAVSVEGLENCVARMRACAGAIYCSVSVGPHVNHNCFHKQGRVIFHATEA